MSFYCFLFWSCANFRNSFITMRTTANAFKSSRNSPPTRQSSFSFVNIHSRKKIDVSISRCHSSYHPRALGRKTFYDTQKDVKGRKIFSADPKIFNLISGKSVEKKTFPKWKFNQRTFQKQAKAFLSLFSHIRHVLTNKPIGSWDLFVSCKFNLISLSFPWNLAVFGLGSSVKQVDKLLRLLIKEWY